MEAQIADVYRLNQAKRSVSSGKQPAAVEITSVSPAELDKGIPLENCQTGWYMVNYFRDPKGSVKYQVRHT